MALDKAGSLDVFFLRQIMGGSDTDGRGTLTMWPGGAHNDHERSTPRAEDCTRTDAMHG